jgi:hypothetical protein
MDGMRNEWMRRLREKEEEWTPPNIGDISLITIGARRENHNEKRKAFQRTGNVAALTFRFHPSLICK